MLPVYGCFRSCRPALPRPAIAWGTVLVLAVIGAARAEPAADSLSAALATLNQVGHNGSGNRAAKDAWSVVASSDAAQLPRLLAALDDAGPLPANYLRAAIDSVAERTLAAGQKLPHDELQRYVRDTARGPRSRRLAFEWLAKIDADAPDRLVPSFLNDPSLELRREAVARLISEGTKLVPPAAGKRPSGKQAELEQPQQLQQGIALLRRAFDAARDLDQIAALDKQLTDLKQEVNLPRHFGFVTSWHLIGPFDNRDGIGFDAVYPPEERVDFTADYAGKKGAVAWSRHTTTDRHGTVNLNQALGKEMGCVGYAAAEFYSPLRQGADLRLGSACATKLWLNGKLLSRHRVYHTGMAIDQYQSRGTLVPGRNLILIKVCQNEQTDSWAQDWEFQFRVCDTIGTAILSSQPPQTARRDPADLQPGDAHDAAK